MLEVNNVCVSFRSERQEKIFGTARNQVLFDVSLKVSQGTCLGILGEYWENPEVGNLPLAV